MQLNNFGYYWLDSWVLANIIQLATQEFCLRNLNRDNDPCGRLYDQMTQAARSVSANIAEGNSRHSTSKETEMRLTDVARASLSELANDYINWLLRQEQIPWSVKSDEHHAVSYISLDHPTYKDDVQHQSGIHILAQKHKFDKWLCSKDSIVEANCLIVLCNRLIMMHEGHVIYDVSGEEKKALHVSDLLKRFEEASGGHFANDRMMLAN